MALKTVPATPERESVPLRVRQAASLIEEIALLANQVDRECYFNGGAMVSDRDPEEVELQLDRLRGAIQQMGWMADLATETLGGGLGPTRGGKAELWLLSPVYNSMKEAGHG